MAIIARVFTFIVFAAAAVAAQYSYDRARAEHVLPDEPPGPELVRAFDLGLHTAAASLLWLDIRTELPFLPEGPEHYLAGLDLVNDLDPRWSTPYSFTVLVLPTVSKYPDRATAALAVGEKGILEADPDWQIPFYMAAIYQLDLNDRQNAAKYFSLAANTPGVPEAVRRFAINYGIRPDRLAETKAIWTIIHDSSDDESVRNNALAHIAHLEILQYLNAAVGDFRERRGAYPNDIDDLVRAGIIPEIPRSPFGFNFKIYEGGIVGIAP